ncbi:Aste57867_9903 [Aphanomyces stellatus]|uniref:Aste57867_9903 protein n=1 Tax=Aphanomyces stellatus TaxID=120398 RepID=A0A485KPN4_9STRA|nr:hypothetical protein As57867_009864 [Aphanomyces stellatus]VFT86782.1 Aste57867_9903 [Aphanomyces stellatus]
MSVGSVVIVALFAVMVFLRLKKPTGTNDVSYQSSVYQGDESHMKIQDLQLIRLDCKDLSLSKVLGSGGFANVWLGIYHDQVVAVKKLHGAKVTLGQMQSFVNEIQILCTFDLPYIVKLIGAVWTRPSDLQCVMEMMDGGDLKGYLDRYKAQDFAWAEKIVHIYSIVVELVYLHPLNIIHRDLQSRNVLMDSKKGTKLTDFGISKEDMQATMTAGVGTYRWMAPEVIQNEHYTVAADIYSFGSKFVVVSLGCVLSEFSTHHTP